MTAEQIAKVLRAAADKCIPKTLPISLGQQHFHAHGLSFNDPVEDKIEKAIHHALGALARSFEELAK